MEASVVVTGASSQIGYCLLERARRNSSPMTAVARRVPAWFRPAPGLRWEARDLARGWPPGLAAPCLVHAAPLDLLPALVGDAAAAGLERLVAFSSTSVVVKAASPDRAERAVARRLAAAEAELAAACRAAGVRWTILRPTLIYGVGMDRNLSLLAALIGRWRFLPLPAGGRGRRQPVHADDLAGAALAALEANAAAGRTFDLAGGETLGYREIAARIFHARELTPRIVPVPAVLCRVALAVLRLLPAYRDVPAALVARIGEDQVFDDGEARRAIGWDPRPFDARATLSTAP